MAIGIVKIVITILVSKGYFFFFREILSLMNENDSILEIAPEDNGFFLLL